MKILCIANEKGGVGKSLLATQLALYCYLRCGLRVLLIDLDQQANATHILQGYNSTFTTYTLPLNASELFTGDITQALKASEVLRDCATSQAALCLIGADQKLLALERASATYLKSMTGHFSQALKVLSPYFDLCVLDTNPSPDIRANLGLTVCTHLLSPIEFARESLDGVLNLVQRINNAARSNPRLVDGVLGLVPNKVDTTSIQQVYFEQFIKGAGRLLLKGGADLPILERIGQGAARLKRDEQGVPLLEHKDFYCLLKDHAAFREAQSMSLPIWGVSGAQQAWSEFKRLGFTVYERLDFPSRLSTTAGAGQGALRDTLESALQLGTTLQQLYSKAAYLMLRQFLLSDNPAVLPGMSPAQIQDLRVLRTKLSLRDFAALVNHPAEFARLTDNLSTAA